jgi:cytochrome c556
MGARPRLPASLAAGDSSRRTSPTMGEMVNTQSAAANAALYHRAASGLRANGHDFPDEAAGDHNAVYGECRKCHVGLRVEQTAAGPAVTLAPARDGRCTPLAH